MFLHMNAIIQQIDDLSLRHGPQMYGIMILTSPLSVLIHVRSMQPRNGYVYCISNPTFTHNSELGSLDNMK